MNEFDLIKQYFRNVSPVVEGTALGNGDDCALLQLKPNQTMAVSVDTLVEGVHFPCGANANDIAQRALRTALSDLAAMAATPRWVTLALTLPQHNSDWLSAFSEGLRADLHTFNCELIGGDTTRGALTISVQVMGVVENYPALARAGAKVGDGVFVSHTVGNGAASLLQVLGKLQSLELPNALCSELDDLFYRPELAFNVAQKLHAVASSAIDISDGLVADLKHICTASGIGAKVNVAQLPYSATAKSLAKGIENTALNSERLTAQQLLQQWALYGGDDYQLCFTAPAHAVAELKKQTPLAATQIGVVVAEQGVQLHNNGQALTVQHKNGYTHFE